MSILRSSTLFLILLLPLQELQEGQDMLVSKIETNKSNSEDKDSDDNSLVLNLDIVT